jgi:hypothetical protein
MKKMIALPVLSLLLLFTAPVKAGLLFTYSQLALKDLDQMNKLVQDKVTESRKSRGDRVVPLKEALQAVFSRPNDDFMIEKVLSPLKSELEEHDAYESALKSLVKEASGALKNPKAFGAVAQVTYAVFLENVIGEMKPKVAENFEKGILTDIRDAKIEISKEAKNERRVRMMKDVESPSALADVVLKAHEQAEAAKKEEEKKKAAEPKKSDGKSD